MRPPPGFTLGSRMAKAREIPGLFCEQPYGDGAALIVEVRTAELADHAAGVLDTEDIERVHDMRVATRRLRAALEVFEPCFPRKPFRAAHREVKELADVLGARRDRDVAIASLRSFAGTIAAPDRPGVESLIAKLSDEQREANETLAEHVTGGRLESLLNDLRKLVSQVYAPGGRVATPQSPAGGGEGLQGDRRPKDEPARAADDLAEHLRARAEVRSTSADPDRGSNPEDR